MRLFYFHGERGVTNFGDELNQLLWPRLLPGAFDEDEETQFVGIGTLLNDRLPAARRTVVFGAGVGYYGPPSRDKSWQIYCVRGPLSAKTLGLPAETAVTDPAVLLARFDTPDGAPDPRWTHAFMPHWQSEAAEWERVCAGLGIGFIDPRWDPHRVLAALHRSDVLITEAMHGAVVADALRIPWIPVRTRDAINQFKWDDWCQSMDLEYEPHVLPAIWSKARAAGPIRAARRWAKLTLASRALARIQRDARPLLSRGDVLRTRVSQLEDRLKQLAADMEIFRLKPDATRTPGVMGKPRA